MKNRFVHASWWLLAAALLVVTLPLSAAPSVTGVVLNGVSGQPVRGASVTIEGTATETQSDLNGLIALSLEPGTYTASVRAAGFESQKITGIEVSGSGGNFAVVLDPVGGAGDAQTLLDEITVEAEAGLATETALLTERKNAAQISDSIGAEEMSKSTGSDAAGVLKRVTGVSLEGGKFAYVRGLGDRYSTTALNGSKMPSTEFEKKTVPLDLFPAGLIEKITVSKSYTVDKPGDFAAGAVELTTVQFPNRQVASIGISGGFNSITTGEPLLEHVGGLSFSGSGGQALPSSVPSDPLVRFSPILGTGIRPEELERIGESIGGEWTPEVGGDAPFDKSLKATYGNTFGKFGFMVSINHENDFTVREEDRNIFRLSGGEVQPSSFYSFDYGVEKVRQALTANLGYKFNNNNQIRFRSLFTELSEAESRFQKGFFTDIDSTIENFRLSYQQQAVDNFQLSGEHYFDGLAGGSLLEWQYSMSEATTEENRRETLYEQLPNGDFILTDNAQSGFLFFNDLEDTLDDAKLDWTSFFTGDKYYGSIKAGFARTQNDRDFAGRRIRFDHRNTRGVDLTQRPEELFSPENIGTAFEIQEITRPTDFYRGDHEILAGYVQADLGWGNWRLIGGVRVEDSDQNVITLDRNNPDTPPIVSTVADTDILPSLALVYKLGEATNLRFSASQTVNRPEYRELAPFRFTHIVGGFTATGNPDLERALITSFDARWEWFPSAGEVLAASLFFKDFDSPIENILLAGAERLETFTNVLGAENFGVELELRRDLGRFTPALENFTFIGNYTFVESTIDIGPDNSILTNDSRALVGQPDNVWNAILEWNRPQSGSLVRVLYNFIDDKISQAGGFGLPDVTLQSRGTVDVVWGQSLDKWAPGLDVKISGSNLTNEEWLWQQGDGVFRVVEPGRSISLSLSYKPFN